MLFLCTANSCRSILAEAIFNHLAPAHMHAYSAGSNPCGQVHPQSLRALPRAGIAIDGLHSKTHALCRHWPAVCYRGQLMREGIDSIGVGPALECGRAAWLEL